MKAPPFEYVRAESSAHAAESLREFGTDSRILAGGQSLIPLMSIRLASPSHLIDIGRADDLSFISADNGSVAIGAGARQWTVEHDATVLAKVPLLAAAIGRSGQVPIRHRGTVVGSIAHGDPSAEIPAAFLAHGGSVVAERVGSTRSIPAADFFQGAYMTALEDDELVREVRLDVWPDGTGHAFEEFSHSHESWPVVTAAVLVEMNGDAVARASIVMSGVAGTPTKASQAEANLVGQVPTEETIADIAAIAAADLEPFSDVFGSGKYRKKVAAAMVRRALTTALSRSGGQS
ncbi:MAG: FAD binding domain-containing protein [Acidimicrobiia bacterium]|nr:FAD binding domain-containing protein [Acidimicrobiia bacterium]